MRKANTSNPKIMIFTEGTILGPKSFLGLYFHARYISIGRCIEKIRCWEEQGAEIVYITSRKSEKQVGEIRNLLERYRFPGSQLYYRERKQKYKDLVEQVMPDVLIEDDCRSIGGQWQMCITHVKPELKEIITSIAVKEFKGIDHLPDLLTDLLIYNNRQED
ncbi:MAG: hypothetical protein AAGU75_09290 [Bacillota bacterium]